MRYNELVVKDVGAVEYVKGDKTKALANFPLLIIRLALDRGVDFEDLADGYGPGLGTNGDWSGIRDSSDGAVSRMLERALNHFAGERVPNWYVE
jgi:aryl-alcohol dehydrogenase-like predicted oxidoreductase